jgi:hypothetical protein
VRRKEDFPIQKVTLNLYHGDFEELRALHPRVGAAKVIRELVHAHIARVKDEQAARTDDSVMDQLPLFPIDNI